MRKSKPAKASVPLTEFVGTAAAFCVTVEPPSTWTGSAPHAGIQREYRAKTVSPCC